MSGGSDRSTTRALPHDAISCNPGEGKIAKGEGKNGTSCSRSPSGRNAVGLLYGAVCIMHAAHRAFRWGSKAGGGTDLSAHALEACARPVLGPGMSSSDLGLGFGFGS